MKIDNLPSGKYRAKPMVDGKRYSLTFDHYPTDKEINIALRRKMSDTSETPCKAHLGFTFHRAIKEYIELKKDRNSASTLREYDRLERRFSDEFCDLPIDKITQLDVDREVAAWLKKNLSYKTMLNYFTMMQTVIRKFGGQVYSMDMLPEKPKKEEPYIPTSEDVSRMLPYIKKNHPQMYILFWLSTYGLRRGEICALTLDDIDFDNCIVHITKDMVEDANHNWVVKEPKTQASKRDVPICQELCELIRVTQTIYDGHPNSISKPLHKTQDALAIPRFSLHKMRHYCCSELFDLGNDITETDVLYLLGWEEESEVMRQVYKHSRLKTNQDRKKSIANRLSARIGHGELVTENQ